MLRAMLSGGLNPKTISILAILFILAAVAVQGQVVPYAIDGIIFEQDGVTQVNNMNFSVTNLDTGWTANGSTGLGPDPGKYSTPIAGNSSDLIQVRSWILFGETGTNNSVERNVTLSGVIHDFHLVLNTSLPNFAPNIISSPIETGFNEDLYEYQVQIFERNDDAVTYNITIGPENLTIDSNGVVQWNATYVTTGNYSVEINVSDGELHDTQNYTLRIEDINDPPDFTSEGNETAYEDMPYVYTAVAVDPEGLALVYAVLQAPAGFAINSSTGVVNFTPDADDVGDTEIILTASDGTNTVEHDYTLIIEETPDPPSIVSVPIVTTSQDSFYTYQMVVSDEDTEFDDLIFTLVEGPEALEVDSSGVVNWFPEGADVGVYNITITVDDGTNSTTQTYNLTVLDLADAPAVNNTAPWEGIEDVLYTHQINATDPDGDDVIYTLYSGPIEATVNASGYISWIPNDDVVGYNDLQETSLIINVSDGNNTNLYNITVLISNRNDIPVLPSVNTTFFAEDAITYTIPVLDADNDSLIFNLTKSPNDLSVDRNTGVITWTPTSADVGSHQINVSITDANVTINETFYFFIDPPQPASSSSGGGGSDGGGGGGGAATLRRTIDVSDLNTPVDSVAVSYRGILNNEDLIVKHFGTRPSETIPVGLPVYKYLELDLLGSATAQSAIVSFSVPMSWLDGLEATPEEVVLLHFKNNKWEQLETTLLQVEDGEAAYSAVTGSFSFFAISLNRTVDVEKLVPPPRVTTLQERYIVYGRIFLEEGLEVAAGTPYRVVINRTGETIEGVTGGPSPGTYSVVLHAQRKDAITFYIHDKTFTMDITVGEERRDFIVFEKEKFIPTGTDTLLFIALIIAILLLPILIFLKFYSSLVPYKPKRVRSTKKLHGWKR